ncbi:hypothetical protein D3C85_1318440 [compost metagenome]
MMSFITQATNTAATIPTRYITISARPCRLKIPSTCFCGIIKDMIRIYTGSLAEQLTKGVTKMVIIRSFQFSIFLAAIIEGTAQAKPPIIGTTDLPLSPTLLIILSIIKVTRAM